VGCKFTHPRKVPFKSPYLLRGCTLRCEASCIRLNGQPNLVNVDEFLAVDLANDGSDPGYQFKQAFVGKLARRLAHRSSADANFLPNRAVKQANARLEFTENELFAKVMVRAACVSLGAYHGDS